MYAVHSSAYISPNSHVASDYDGLHSFSGDNATKAANARVCKVLAAIGLSSVYTCCSPRMLINLKGHARARYLRVGNIARATPILSARRLLRG